MSASVVRVSGGARPAEGVADLDGEGARLSRVVLVAADHDGRAQLGDAHAVLVGHVGDLVDERERALALDEHVGDPRVERQPVAGVDRREIVEVLGAVEHPRHVDAELVHPRVGIGHLHVEAECVGRRRRQRGMPGSARGVLVDVLRPGLADRLGEQPQAPRLDGGRMRRQVAPDVAAVDHRRTKNPLAAERERLRERGELSHPA
jgi:hypothetical protein